MALSQCCLQVERDPGERPAFSTAYAVDGASNDVDKNSGAVAFHGVLMRNEILSGVVSYNSSELGLGKGFHDEMNVACR
jgi:hypothetical protein